MCGICGQYNFKDQKPVDPELIRKMTQTMIHRGPDDEGYYFSGNLGFGFRRLSIIDLKGGHQPMSDREKSVWVVFNGHPYLLHGSFLLAGYLWGLITQMDRPVSKELMGFHRKEELAKLKAILKTLCRFKKIDNFRLSAN